MSEYINIYDHINANVGDDRGAEKTQAAVTRAMWDEYESTYLPYLTDLAQIGSREGQQEMTDDLVGGIKDNYNNYTDRVTGRTERTSQRYGLSQTPRQSAYTERLAELNKAAGLNRDTYKARIDAANRTEALLTGGALSKEGLVDNRG